MGAIVQGVGWVLLIFSCVQAVAAANTGDSIHSHGHKLTKTHSKFLLTSTLVENWSAQQQKLKNNQSAADCIHLDILVPEMYDPIYLCLKLQDLTKSAFHKDFRLKVVNTDTDDKKTTILKDLFKETGLVTVNGHVKGAGVSYISGYVKDKNFYGTIIFSHLIGQRMIMCSVSPNTKTNLEGFMDMSAVEDEDLKDVLSLKTVKVPPGQKANAIVSCGDMHRNDDHDVKNPFSFIGFPNPTNVVNKVTSKMNKMVNNKRSRRVKRQDPQDPPAPFDLPDAPLPFDSAAEVLTMAPIAVNETEPKSPKPGRFLKKLFNKNKNGTYFTSICYIVDLFYLERRFNGSPEDATVLFGGFVDLADWILRATDFDRDGFPDNIGIRLLEVSVQYITAQMKRPTVIWGREFGGKFDNRRPVFEQVQQAGILMGKDCDIRSAIGEVNTGKYALYERGGCTACKSDKLSSFTNPYVETYSHRGEFLRLLYHQLRLLAFAYVSEESVCHNCSGVGTVGQIGSFDAEKIAKGACIIEGDLLLGRSNLPLNAFRLSTCSIDEGVKCFEKIATRGNCLEFVKEESYCGNGIVEGDEECDCGALSTCMEERCTCGVRTGVRPCRLLDVEETEFCLSLIRCRGYRFLYELGQANSSQFISNLPEFITTTRNLSNEPEEVTPETRNNFGFGTNVAPEGKFQKFINNFWGRLAINIIFAIYIFKAIMIFFS